MTDKNDLGKLLAIDMPNGFTYIGRGNVDARPLMLKEAITIKTDYAIKLVSIDNKSINAFDKGLCANTYNNLIKQWNEYKIDDSNKKITKSDSELLTKLSGYIGETRIDNPGPINFLD